MELKQNNVFDTGRRVQTLLVSESAVLGTTVPAPLQAQLDTNAVADAAAKHEKDFLDHGMPTDFIAQLGTAVGALNASVDTRGKQKGLLKQATQGVKDSTKAVRDVLHVIDANMKRVLKKNQPLLANWVATKRIQATVVTPLPGGDLNVTPVTTASTKPVA